MSLRMVSWRSLALGWCALFLVSLWSTGAHAYIPAVAVNDTLPTTDNSSLWISWDSGETTEDVSYQLVGADSTGISQVRSRVVRSVNFRYPILMTDRCCCIIIERL